MHTPTLSRAPFTRHGVAGCPGQSKTLLTLARPWPWWGMHPPGGHGFSAPEEAAEPGKGPSLLLPQTRCPPLGATWPPGPGPTWRHFGLSQLGTGDGCLTWRSQGCYQTPCNTEHSPVKKYLLRGQWHREAERAVIPPQTPAQHRRLFCSRHSIAGDL